MAKVKLLDNLIVGDGLTLEVGAEIDTEDHGIDAAGLDNLLSWKAVEVIKEPEPEPAAVKSKKAKGSAGADSAGSEEDKKAKDSAGADGAGSGEGGAGAS